MCWRIWTKVLPRSPLKLLRLRNLDMLRCGARGLLPLLHLKELARRRHQLIPRSLFGTSDALLIAHICFFSNGLAAQVSRLAARNRSETAMFLHKGIATATTDGQSMVVAVILVSMQYGLMCTLCQRVSDQSLLVVYFSTEIALEQRIAVGSVVQVHQPWYASLCRSH